MKTLLSRSRTHWSRYSQSSFLQASSFTCHCDSKNKEEQCNNNSNNILSFARNNSNFISKREENINTNSETLQWLRNVAKGAASVSTASSSGSAATAASAALVTTSAGYTLTPLTITMISNAPLLAFALVQASGIGPIRQIMSEGQTKELSPFPFVSLYTNCAIWTLYGVLQSDQTIFIANAAGVIAGLIYTGIFAKNTHISMMPYYFGSFSLLSIMLSSPFWIGSTENAVQLLGSFGCASAVILMASPLSVVGTVLKEKATESMPFAMSLAMTLNGTAWGAYGWMVANDVYIWLPNILGASAGVVQVALHAMYGINSSSKKIE